MEEQRLYLHAPARGSQPRGYVQRRRRTVVLCTRGWEAPSGGVGGLFWGVAQSLRWNRWWGDSEGGVKGAVRRSWGKRPWAFDCEKSFRGKTPGILYLFVSEIFICHAGRFIMGLSVSSAHSRVRTCCPEHPLWISRE